MWGKCRPPPPPPPRGTRWCVGCYKVESKPNNRFTISPSVHAKITKTRPRVTTLQRCLYAWELLNGSISIHIARRAYTYICLYDTNTLSKHICFLIITMLVSANKSTIARSNACSLQLFKWLMESHNWRMFYLRKRPRREYSLNGILSHHPIHFRWILLYSSTYNHMEILEAVAFEI